MFNCLCFHGVAKPLSLSYMKCINFYSIITILSLFILVSLSNLWDLQLLSQVLWSRRLPQFTKYLIEFEQLISSCFHLRMKTSFFNKLDSLNFFLMLVMNPSDFEVYMQVLCSTTSCRPSLDGISFRGETLP